ncbi:corepressor interacting with RBPJ 1-like [Haliotis rufescens]|uniref:corepressor interacting with RBPJ 1-like n=1 Tax=Haliotis rufescens TaxID=6454 RepID=UPI00201ED60F|nr:corepressor interacting with RBPJ 1-like [Haliotis rufescens]
MRSDHSSGSDGENGIPVSPKHGRHVPVSYEATTAAGTSHEANNNQSHEAVGNNGRPNDVDLENRSRKQNRKDWKGFTIPKRDQAKSRHRHRKRSDSSTSSSPSDSSSSSSSSDSSSSESSVSEDCETNNCTISTDNHLYKRFKPTDDRAEQELSNELLDYAQMK